MIVTIRETMLIDLPLFQRMSSNVAVNPKRQGALAGFRVGHDMSQEIVSFTIIISMGQRYSVSRNGRIVAHSMVSRFQKGETTRKGCGVVCIPVVCSRFLPTLAL